MWANNKLVQMSQGNILWQNALFFASCFRLFVFDVCQMHLGNGYDAFQAGIQVTRTWALAGFDKRQTIDKPWKKWTKVNKIQVKHMNQLWFNLSRPGRCIFVRRHSLRIVCKGLLLRLGPQVSLSTSDIVLTGLSLDIYTSGCLQVLRVRTESLWIHDLKRGANQQCRPCRLSVASCSDLRL